MPTVPVEVVNKSAGQVVNGDFKEVFPCFFFIQECLTKLGEIILKGSVSKSFTFHAAAGWFWMRVALLQISCVCHHMAPMARGRPAGPVTDPPNNGLLLSNVYSFLQLYYLPVLSTAMPLPTTICSPVLGDSYLLPISNALVLGHSIETEKKNSSFVIS